MCVRMCMCVCERANVRACVCACGRVCLYAHARACTRVCLCFRQAILNGKGHHGKGYHHSKIFKISSQLERRGSVSIPVMSSGAVFPRVVWFQQITNRVFRH